MCPHCRAFITTRDRVCPYCGEKVGPRAADVRDASGIIGGFIPHARFNTVLILVINFGLYLATSIYSMKGGAGGAMDIDVQTLGDFGAKWGPAIAAGQWWRLITAGFLHGGLLHILMNSWVLFDVGAQVEEVFGASRMWVIYSIANVTGFYLSDVWRPLTPSVGASAALFGLIGAMIAASMRSSHPMAGAIRGMYVRWAVYMLIFSLVIPGIDMAAHVGGLAGGFGMGYLGATPRYEGSPAERVWRIASWLCVLITVVAFLEMGLAFTRGA